MVFNNATVKTEKIIALEQRSIGKDGELNTLVVYVEFPNPVLNFQNILKLRN
jgi:hypothetical protein